MKRQSSGFTPKTSSDARITFGSGLAGKTIGALHVMEVRKQSKHFEHGACGGRALGCRRRFPAGQRGQRFRDAGIRLGGRVTSRQVARAIVGDHLVHVLARSIREEIWNRSYRWRPM